jgi:uncharacterized membrane protein
MIDILITILLGSFKFAMTFPLAVLEFKYSFFETVLWINIGGILGIYFFAYLSEGLNRWLIRTFSTRKRNRKREKARGNKKIFTKRNRRIIRIKQRYGLIGIAATTPVLLSIPVGVFLVVRYYPRVKTRFVYLITANIAWSLIFTSFYMFWNDLLFVK